jgi:hypothetical protein
MRFQIGLIHLTSADAWAMKLVRKAESRSDTVFLLSDFSPLQRNGNARFYRLPGYHP